VNSEDFRRAWVYAASLLLVAAVAQIVIGVWTLSGLPGGPTVSGPGFIVGGATAAPFWLRATEAMPNLVQLTVTALPVAAVLLVAFAGCSPRAARRVTLAAVIVQTVALVLGLIAWVAALGETNRWTAISWVVEIAVAVAGLVLTSAFLRWRGAVMVTRPQEGTGEQ
jgi:hypothetical protein